MKKLSLLLLAFGLLPAAAYAAAFNTTAAAQQSALNMTTTAAAEQTSTATRTPTMTQVPATTNTTKLQSFTTMTAAEQRTTLPTLSLTEQKAVLADSLTVGNDAILTKGAVLEAYPKLTLDETVKASTVEPYFEFDKDLTEASEFHLKYKLDDNGLMTKYTKDQLAAKELAVLESEFKINCETYPQLCAVKEWNPETENKYDPFVDRYNFCRTYRNRCYLKLDLAKKFISNNDLLEPAVITRPAKPILISSFNCLGVKCGAGKYCVKGCCHYFKKLTADLTALKEVTLAESVKTKYKIEDLKLVALPVSIKDGSAKLVIDNPVHKELILDKQIKMDNATQLLQRKIETLK